MLHTLRRLARERLLRWENRLHEPVDLRLERRRPADGPPIFVLAAPFSGAGHVMSVLERHPRLACAHETLFMVGLLATLREHNCVMGYQTIGVSHDAAVANIRVLARNYYERFLYVSGKSRWVDSTSSHALFASELEEVFAPDVRFVHVIRHGVDVARAIAEAGGVKDGFGHWVDYFHQEDDASPGERERLHAAANLWQTYNRIVHEFTERHPASCHVIHSEDLDDNPQPAARALFEFLGEEWTPGLIEGAPPDATSGPPRRRWEASADVREVHERLAPDLARYGYDAARS